MDNRPLYTLAANPLKLREYIAAGLPVVSSAIPEAERLSLIVQWKKSGRGGLAISHSAIRNLHYPFAIFPIDSVPCAEHGIHVRNTIYRENCKMMVKVAVWE